MKNKKGLVFAAMGFELAGLMIAGLYLGQALDEKYDLKGLGIAGLSFLVIIGWTVHLIVLINNYTRAEAAGKNG